LTDSTSCDNTVTCCAHNEQTCGGLMMMTTSCGSGKAVTAATDAWKTTSSAAASYATDCCGDVGTCTAYMTASTTAAASDAPQSQPTMIVGLCTLAMAAIRFA
jgi:hypothetical protein